VHEEGKTFLQKPFTPHALVAQVRILLDGQVAAGNNGTEPAA
jgi:DNA-binding response OmpR family regulator